MVRFRRLLLALALIVAAVPSPLWGQRAAAAPAAKTATADSSLLDINTATPAQLKALPGIGDAYTKRIVDGRPYTAKNQLTTRGILPAATYKGIQDKIIAKAPKK